jgi:GT2 family glycosyltransferase
VSAEQHIDAATTSEASTSAGTGTAPADLQASIVVIAFNEAARIGRCLDALTRQDHTGEHEIIVVDDGSTDETAEIAARYAPAVRVVRLAQNQGRGAARRAGVDAARGTAIGFVDADIVVGEDWLRRCLDTLPGRAAVGGIAVPDGDIAPLARITGATLRPIGGSMPITGNNVLFDGEILRRTGFDETARLGEDFRLAARLLEEGHLLERVPGLEVAHHETKTYRKSLGWLHESGIDATTLLVEHRRVRTPDLAWAGSVGALTAGVLLALRRGPYWLLLGPLALLGVSVLHTVTRFRPRPVGRFLAALLLNIPLTASYLAGRTRGTARHLTRAGTTTRRGHS